MLQSDSEDYAATFTNLRITSYCYVIKKDNLIVFRIDKLNSSYLNINTYMSQLPYVEPSTLASELPATCW